MKQQFRAMIVAGLAAVALGGVAAGIASAGGSEDCYPVGTPTCPEGPQVETPTPATVPSGNALTLTGTNFPAGSNVLHEMETVPPAVLFRSTGIARPQVLINFGSSLADAGGTSVVNGVAPAQAVYKATASTTFNGQFYSASARVDVTASTSNPPPPIPGTGSNVGGILMVAGVALVAGLGLVGAGKARSRKTVPA